MSTTRNLLLSALAASVLLTSCNDCQTTVTQVKEKDVEWLVYKGGDTAVFENEEGKKFSYVRSNVFSNNVPGTGFNISDECISHYDVEVGNIIQNIANKQPGLATYILRRTDTLHVELIVEDRGNFRIDHTNPTYPEYEVNGKIYKQVFEVKPEKTKPNSVQRILFNKEKGFLSVDFYDGRKLLLTNKAATS